MSFKAFLTLLLSLGPHLPAILAALRQLYEAVKPLIPADQPRGLMGADDETAELEAQVMAAAGGETFAGERGLLTPLYSLYEWLERSGLLAVLALIFSRPQV